jgi:hypothetical protein
MNTPSASHDTIPTSTVSSSASMKLRRAVKSDAAAAGATERFRSRRDVGVRGCLIFSTSVRGSPAQANRSDGDNGIRWPPDSDLR